MFAGGLEQSRDTWMQLHPLFDRIRYEGERVVGLRLTSRNAWTRVSSSPIPNSESLKAARPHPVRVRPSGSHRARSQRAHLLLIHVLAAVLILSRVLLVLLRVPIHELAARIHDDPVLLLALLDQTLVHRPAV